MPNAKRGRPPNGQLVPCAKCGKPIYRHPSNLGHKYCSFDCRDAARRAVRVNEADGTAKCARCREWKPVADFVRGKRGKPQSYCKPCNAVYFAERRGIPPAQRRPYRAAYRLTPEEKAQKKREANHLAHQRRRAGGVGPDKWDIQRMNCSQEGRCAYCGELLSGRFHIDHKQPVSRGGINAQANLHLTCPRCNIRKGKLTHEEFLVSKRRRAWRSFIAKGG